MRQIRLTAEFPVGGGVVTTSDTETARLFDPPNADEGKQLRWAVGVSTPFSYPSNGSLSNGSL